MERPIRDIQQHIDYVGTLAEEEPDPKTRWQLQKRVAASVWQRDAKAYYEEQGAEFFDFGQAARPGLREPTSTTSPSSDTASGRATGRSSRASTS